MKRPTWLRAIDWKFWIALSLAVLVGYLAFVGYAAVQDGREKDRQNAALIRTIESKDQQADRAAAAAADAAATSSANQAALLDYTKALADRQHALLEWLRANGIEIPTRYVVEIRPPKIVKQSTPKHSKRAQADRTRKRVDLPGKSERGHSKGRGRR